MAELTADRLRELFAYDPATGIFTYKVKTAKRVHIGDRAGWLDSTGYRRMRVDGRAYLEHRLAWLFVTGQLPTDLIDHRNRDKADNRFDNLRECSHEQNLQNVDGHSSCGASRYRGVYYHRQNRNWTAAITVHQRQKHLGVFHCETAAYAAYCRAKASLHQFATGA